ncbi:MAG TPA: DNA-binding protein [Pseudolabrys sp.]
MTSRKHQRQDSTTPSTSNADLLFGAEAISLFLFNDPKFRRRVYHLAEKHNLPKFYIGSTICARRSRLKEWLDTKDQPTASGQGGEPDENETSPMR